MIWTPGRIAALSTQEVKDLASNASARGRDDVAELCQKALEARKPKPNHKFQLPEGFSKIVRTSIGKTLESDANEFLIAFANEFAFETTLSGLAYLRKIELWQRLGHQVKLWFLSLPNEDIAEP